MTQRQEKVLRNMFKLRTFNRLEISKIDPNMPKSSLYMVIEELLKKGVLWEVNSGIYKIDRKTYLYYKYYHGIH